MLLSLEALGFLERLTWKTMLIFFEGSEILQNSTNIQFFSTNVPLFSDERCHNGTETQALTNVRESIQRTSAVDNDTIRGPELCQERGCKNKQKRLVPSVDFENPDLLCVNGPGLKPESPLCQVQLEEMYRNM